MHYVIEKFENDTRSRKVVIDKTNHFSNEKHDYIIKLFDTKVEVKTFEPQKEIPKKYSMPTLGNLDDTEVEELWLQLKLKRGRNNGWRK